MSEFTAIDRTGCVGNMIKVAAGHYVDLANPLPESIDICTIAAALSKMCRFGCHTPRFYSVAEHCVHATVLAAREGAPRDAMSAVFLHDAAEAYVGDIVKPLKVMLSDYMDIEKQMAHAVEKAFGVNFERWSESVKRFDLIMLKAERLTFWPEDHEPWPGLSEIECRHVPFYFWMPNVAEEAFIHMAVSLGLLDHFPNDYGNEKRITEATLGQFAGPIPEPVEAEVSE